MTAQIAQKVKRLQQRGYTAETVVLTAVAQAAPHMPEIIHKARGPVQESGPFPGVPIIPAKGAQSPPTAPSADVRLQYQVSRKHLPKLREIAQQYGLRRSTLVRLALGHYFSLPVRLSNRA